MDDQAETVLMRLSRGSGFRGLSAMRMEVIREGVWLVRPWIQARREAIRAWARTQALAWDEDPFNEEEQLARVAVRRGVIPAMNQAMKRDVVPALARMADIASEEDDWMQGMVAEVLAAARDRSAPDKLVVPAFQGAHPALVRRVILAWLESLHLSGIGAKEVEAVRRLVETPTSASVNLARGYRVRRTARRLWLDPPDPRQKPKIP
jgi:tRNA(Ile)-lysidine synthase